ncbi:hypothetical protein [Burkholderia sp. ABCPW 14]|uniref:hypothetical protein n=1 Tax=Burkholderia sp. ABCPW 14 TaxID=1637860 RepID=UPI0012E37B1B|nr:hypothetical protein [Burkholderia sp. ABCPW 14]
MAIATFADRRALYVVRRHAVSNAGGQLFAFRLLGAVTGSIRTLAIMSRSHSGCGIQQDLTVFVKPMHIDMNCSDVVEMLLRTQTRENGAILRRFSIGQ